MALKAFSMRDVSIGDINEHNAFNKEMRYLKKLDADRLLKGFCEIGNIGSDALLYGGWESSDIRGHTLGHYLTAVCQGYATSGDAALKNIADHIIDVLAQCQNDAGYLAAIPESHFDKIEAGDTEGTWVPWYNMHKIFSALIDAYELTENEKALEIAKKLGNWVCERASGWSEDVHAAVLSVEYGGMNDCLYRLYMHTRDEKHLFAAHAFDEMTLFEPIANGEDILDGKHANTTIPKFLGAVRAYLATGEEIYLKAAESFFDIVTRSHTYITGGNSEWEHFGEAGVLDAERTNCNCETCNTHNMLKLARELFMITKKRCYADYYENTFINAILSSQNPETGMTTYFQPMATGYFKVFSSETEHFWCCTGTGMENFSKLSDSIYFHEDDSLWVLRYTPSRLYWKETGMTIEQNTNLPLSENVRFILYTDDGKPRNASIVLRVPDWCKWSPAVMINGEDVPVSPSKGFIRIERQWNDGDFLEAVLPLGITAHGLPDNENVFAFKYGPLLLSADLGNENMETGTTGVNVTIPLSNDGTCDTLTVTGSSAQEWIKHINDNMVRQRDSLCFIPKGVKEELRFTPHYMQYEHRYGIYFRITEEN